MKRIDEDWIETRERLRMIVEERGVSSVAANIPCDRVTLFRLLAGRTRAPSLPTQECIERMLDDEDLRRQ